MCARVCVCVCMHMYSLPMFVYRQYSIATHVRVRDIVNETEMVAMFVMCKIQRRFH